MTENFPGVPGPADAPRPTESWSAESGAGAGDPAAQPSAPSPSVPDPAAPSPSAPDPSAAPASATSPWAPGYGGPSGATPPTGTPAGGVGQNPYPATGAQPAYHPPAGGYPGYQQQPTAPVQPGVFGPPTGTATYPVGGAEAAPRRRRGPGFVVGVALLALVVGGGAGGLGGYLVAHNTNNAPTLSALDQPAPANNTANAPAGSVQAVAGRLLPVVVTIAAEFSTPNGASGDTGSGFIISSTGDILTNNHVIASAANNGHIQVIFANNRTATATIVGRDPTTDVAVIHAQGVSGLPVAQLGRSDDLAVGQEVVAIGAPFQLSGTVTSGIVSSLHRPTEAGDGGDATKTTVLDAIQTDAPINPGNSGGPLVNMSGQVVGINSAIYSPNSGGFQGGGQGGNVGIGFAIPIDQAKRIADQIVKTGHATQTVLGVKVTDNTGDPNSGQGNILPNGARISEVTQGGPADKAGLKAGAVVVKVNDRAVSGSDGLVAAVHAAAPGDQMKLTLSDGSTVTVTLAGQPVTVN